MSASPAAACSAQAPQQKAETNNDKSTRKIPVVYPTGDERDFLARVALLGGSAASQQEDSNNVELHSIVFGGDMHFGLCLVMHSSVSTDEYGNGRTPRKCGIARDTRNFCLQYMRHRIEHITIKVLELGRVAVVFICCGPKRLPSPSNDDDSNNNNDDGNSSSATSSPLVVLTHAPSKNADRRYKNDAFDPAKLVGVKTLSSEEEVVSLLVLKRKREQCDQPVLCQLHDVPQRVVQALFTGPLNDMDSATLRYEAAAIQTLFLSPTAFKAALPASPSFSFAMSSDFEVAVALMNAAECLLATCPPLTYQQRHLASLEYADPVVVTDSNRTSSVAVFSQLVRLALHLNPKQTDEAAAAAAATAGTKRKLFPDSLKGFHRHLVIADSPSDLLQLDDNSNNSKLFSSGGATVVLFRRQRITSREVTSFASELTSHRRYPVVTTSPQSQSQQQEQEQQHDTFSCLQRPTVIWFHTKQLTETKPAPPPVDIFVVASYNPRDVAAARQELEVGCSDETEAHRLADTRRVDEVINITSARFRAEKINDVVHGVNYRCSVAGRDNKKFFDWEVQQLIQLSKWKSMSWAPVVDTNTGFVSCSASPNRWISRPFRDRQCSSSACDVVFDPDTALCVPRIRVKYVRQDLAQTSCAFQPHLIYRDVILLDLPLALSRKASGSSGNSSNANSNNSSRLFGTDGNYNTIALVLSFLTVKTAMKSLARVNRHTWHAFDELRLIDRHCRLLDIGAWNPAHSYFPKIGVYGLSPYVGLSITHLNATKLTILPAMLTMQLWRQNSSSVREIEFRSKPVGIVHVVRTPPGCTDMELACALATGCDDWGELYDYAIYRFSLAGEGLKKDLYAGDCIKLHNVHSIWFMRSRHYFRGEEHQPEDVMTYLIRHEMNVVAAFQCCATRVLDRPVVITRASLRGVKQEAVDNNSGAGLFGTMARAASATASAVRSGLGM